MLQISAFKIPAGIVCYAANQRTFRLQSSKFFPKKFLIFFPKKLALKKFLILSQKNVSNFQEMELSYIQKPYIFITTSILRTLVYLEPDAYLEHCQTSLMESFAKIITQHTFNPRLKNKKTQPEKLSYIFSKKKKKKQKSENGTFLCFEKWKP